MRSQEFPFILSPNLGCPRIVELEKARISIHLIVAGRSGDGTIPPKEVLKDLFKLVPSYTGEGREADLVVSEDPVEITDWNQLPNFSATEDTQMLINSELHYMVLGRGTRYWKVHAAIVLDNLDGLLREKEVNGKRRELPTLYDLVMMEEPGRYRKINYHAIQFVKQIKKGDCNFLHVTDLHVAKRNDEMLDEVVKVKNVRTKQEIESTYINFNRNLRDVIRTANDLADRGEVDFVLFTGDLVDYAFHGWEDEVNIDENNFKEFIDIVVGRGHERFSWQNEGLKVALFTSTGNHDWRLHPYDPGSIGREETFGLKQREVKNYPYRSFDASEYPEDKRARLALELSEGALKRLNLNALNTRDKWKMRIGKLTGRIYSSNFISRLLARFIPGVGVLSLLTHSILDPASLQQEFFRLTSHYIPLFAIVISFATEGVAVYLANRMASLLVDNPLHAEARALHYYFAHINPYFDYSFSYGSNHFILMDTGRDLFAGNLLDGKKVKNLKRTSITDNFIGSSPDSRAFDSEQLYYNWSQIVWLEKVLRARGIQKNDCVFIGLHAPSVNVPDGLYKDLPWCQKTVYQIYKLIFRRSRIYDRITSWADIRESNPDKKIKNDWISRDEIDLTYGTINHYVSQFFYLCLGLTETENRNEPSQATKRITMVLSGHAHRNVEFSVDLHWNDRKEENEIRIFSDTYSDPSPALGDRWKNRPLLIQTAACGPPGVADKKPPYYRKIEIEGGEIKGFKIGHTSK